MKSVLITGASTGFGFNTGLELARRGWLVFAAMRDTTKGEALLEHAEGFAVKDNIVILQMDVTDSASVSQAIAQLFKRTGGTLDALFNNAGYSVLGAFEDIGDEGCRAQMETNFYGALAVTRAVLPAMRAAERGRIVVTTSNAVNTPHPMLSIYAASKWALEGWAEGLAMEVAPFGIQVVVAQPGAHRTPFAQNVQFVQPEGSAYARWLEQAGPSVADLDQWGRPPELATAPLVDAITADEVPFRILIGEDTQVFAALKGAAPYELRAMALRAITGAPAMGAFTKVGIRSSDANWPVASQILKRVAGAVSDDPVASDVLAQTFKFQKREA